MLNIMYDNSSISQFSKCPMSYYLQYILQLKKKYIDDSNQSKQFGDYFHKFVESQLKKTSFTLEGYEAPEDLPQYSKKALETFCKTYIDKYSMEDKEYELLNIEDVFEFDLGGYPFKVKCDAVIGHRGNIYGLELKTTKSISYNYFSKYFLNSQISAQCYAIKQKYGQCSGILLRVGETKVLKRKPTGDYDSVTLVEDGYVTSKFTSDFINRNNRELEDWSQNTVQWITAIENSNQAKFYPKATGSWGGTICSTCEYRDLCKVSKGLEIDEEIKDVLYEEVDATNYLTGDKDEVL